METFADLRRADVAGHIMALNGAFEAALAVAVEEVRASRPARRLSIPTKGAEAANGSRPENHPKNQLVTGSSRYAQMSAIGSSGAAMAARRAAHPLTS